MTRDASAASTHPARASTSFMTRDASAASTHRARASTSFMTRDARANALTRILAVLARARHARKLWGRACAPEKGERAARARDPDALHAIVLSARRRALPAGTVHGVDAPLAPVPRL